MGVQSSEFRCLCPLLRHPKSSFKYKEWDYHWSFLCPVRKVEAFIVSCNNDLIRPKSNQVTHSHLCQAEFTVVILFESAEFCVAIEIV